MVARALSTLSLALLFTLGLASIPNFDDISVNDLVDNNDLVNDDMINNDLAASNYSLNDLVNDDQLATTNDDATTDCTTAQLIEMSACGGLSDDGDDGASCTDSATCVWCDPSGEGTSACYYSTTTACEASTAALTISYSDGCPTYTYKSPTTMPTAADASVDASSRLRSFALAPAAVLLAVAAFLA